MSRPPRFVFVVLDGVGVGALPDAAAYGDEGTDTLGNLARYVPLRLPNLGRLGLGNLALLPDTPPVEAPTALIGRLAERSAGKDTTAGHWEHMGLVTEVAFPTYPNGFPPDVIAAFEEAIGRGVLGNVPASGTEIIAELGDEHVRTGRPIVYTSADSVFQIAAHVEVIPLDELYRYCHIARELLRPPHQVGRVIARPFAGEAGGFYRTPDRKDFSVAPPEETYLDRLVEAGVEVTGIGKIPQIFAGRGVTTSLAAASNEENLALLARLLVEATPGLIFTNLVDFDMKWGHRNDPEGFAAGLEVVDAALPEILAGLDEGDRLLLSADHGVDPTTVSTDHSREYVPLLLYPRPTGAPHAVYQGWFSDTGATAVAHLTGAPPPGPGRSLLDLRPGRGWSRYPQAPVRGGSTREAQPEAQTGASRSAPTRAGSAVWELRTRFGAAPPHAVLLGSGLGDAAAGIEVEGEVPYGRLPGWRSPTVEGHVGRLVVGRLAGRRVAVLRGRVHRYEGNARAMDHMLEDLAAWGVRRLLLTSAAGALRGDLRVGSLVRLEEVIDVGQAVHSGVAGRISPSDPEAGLGDLPGAVYASVLGPQYETGAEVEALGALGADVVGMSTAAELRTAHACGLRTSAVSVVTNLAGQVAAPGASEHETVTREAANAALRLGGSIVNWLNAGESDDVGRYTDAER